MKAKPNGRVIVLALLMTLAQARAKSISKSVKVYHADFRGKFAHADERSPNYYVDLNAEFGIILYLSPCTFKFPSKLIY